MDMHGSFEAIAALADEFDYTTVMRDGVFEYRQVVLPHNCTRHLPPDRLLDEAEWRAAGVTMSCGWVHYDAHGPEQHILLFRRPLGTDPKTGEAPKAQASAAMSRQEHETRLAVIRAQGLRQAEATDEGDGGAPPAW